MEAELWLWEGSMFTKELGEKEEKQQKESCASSMCLVSLLPFPVPPTLALVNPGQETGFDFLKGHIWPTFACLSNYKPE